MEPTNIHSQLAERIAKLEAHARALTTAVQALMAKVAVLEFAYAALPDEYVIPGPKGEQPPGTGTALRHTLETMEQELRRT